jgi:hypothetical protein
LKKLLTPYHKSDIERQFSLFVKINIFFNIIGEGVSSFSDFGNRGKPVVPGFWQNGDGKGGGTRQTSCRERSRRMNDMRVHEKAIYRGG